MDSQHEGLLPQCWMKMERTLLQGLILLHAHHLFHNLFFQAKILQIDPNVFFHMECYSMDQKIIQLVIRGILESGQYTLEGIAYYTRIPFDIILDAACGHQHELSMTAWSRIVGLYMQVRPDVSKLLLKKLLQLESEDQITMTMLLNEA
jgi:hypothetical protein